MKILADYERGLQGYTYLSLEGSSTNGAVAAPTPASVAAAT
jgi:hypothetical protein